MSKAWIEVSPGRFRLVDTSEKPKQGTRTPFIRKEHLTPKARRALKIQLGRDFDSESELRRYMKDNDIRFLDNGEPAEKAKRLRQEWMRETKPGERGRNPACGPRGYGGL